MRLFFSTLLSLTLVLGAALTQLSAQSLSGRRAPSFSLPDPQLIQHDLLDYRGKWLLLDFMRTDCPHCKALTKNIESIKAKYGAKLAVLSVVISPPDTTVTVGKYITENKVTSPIVFDQGQVAISYFKATPQRPSFDTPHLFVINPAGNIVADWGDTDASREVTEGKGLARELDKLMATKQ